MIKEVVPQDLMEEMKVSKMQNAVHSDRPLSISNVEIMKLLREVLRRTKHELWPNDGICHYDKTPSYNVLSVKRFMAQKLITDIEHPPCSLDVSSNDFWVFPRIKSSLKEKDFKIVKLSKRKI